MPLFKKGGANFADPRRSDGEKKPSNNRVPGVGSANATAHTNAGPLAYAPEPQRQPQQQANSNAFPPKTPNQEQRELKQPAPPPPPKFVFYCQLAHGSPTGKVEGFTNVKELYHKIADVFRIHSNEILFCTLNTFRVDMDRLLGGQIGLDDFIFAHVKGQSKLVTVLKSSPALGLTITDNGAGSSFIKRIKEGSIVDCVAQICTGDHIEAVNNETVVGVRHYDVARKLRDLPVGEQITFRLVEPLRGFDGIGPRTSSRGANTSTNPSVASSAVGTGKATLRLRSKGPPVVETQEAPAWELKAAQRIDDLLESFLGIRDPDLAETLVAKSKTMANPSDFAMAIDEEFADFEFPDDFIFDIWGAVTDVKSGRLQ